jgi:hypothetical protein
MFSEPSRRWSLPLALVSWLGCAPTTSDSVGATAGASTATAHALPSAPSAAAASSSSAAPSEAHDAGAAAPERRASEGTVLDCAPLRCRSFATPADALAHVLEVERPVVLALGEAHAQREGGPRRSMVARFTSELLPVLSPRASALVVELLVPDETCGRETVAEVAQREKVVTREQATSNRSEYVALAERARALGIVPYPLRAKCADLEAVRAAKDDAVLAMLDLVTRLLREKVDALLEARPREAGGKPGAAERIVVTYGGAMHNDREPLEGRAQWSFVRGLERAASDRVIELDLVQPESIRDTDAWRRLRWRSAYDASGLAHANVLIAMGPGAYALVLAREPSAPAAAPASARSPSTSIPEAPR